MKLFIEYNTSKSVLPHNYGWKGTLNYREQESIEVKIKSLTITKLKTSVIRNLITNHPAKYILITTSMAEHLAQPTFMTFMQNNKDSIFILEDCEQILVDRTAGNYSCAITNILNTADGLMSDIFNIKFICTFNADISKIDKALLRKGRCFVNYEFKELSEDKTKILLNRQGIELDSYKPMTLADIYNYTDTDCTKQTNKIGF